jgi:hypothetical protein
LNSGLTVYEAEQVNNTQNSLSSAGSRREGKSMGKTGENIALSTLKNISIILSGNVALHREKRQTYQFGSLPSDLASEARYKIAGILKYLCV